MKTKDLKKIIKENTVSLKHVFSDLTDEEKKVVDKGIIRYDMLLNIKLLRKRLKLSQAKFAEKANLPRTTITKIESGSYNPTVNTLMSIAYALNKKLEVKFA
jgi:DNA-binding XRE family transcriptional regulator